MAVNKRAKKKTTARGRSTPRKRGHTGTTSMSLFAKLRLLLVLGICAIIATYYFGSFKLRSQMDRVAMQAIQIARSPEWMPQPIINILNMGYDTIPESEGLVVEAGELGDDASPLLAGVPQSKSAVRVLRNKSYINLFNEKNKQTACIAFKINGDDRQQANIPKYFFEDPRIKQLSAKDMQLGQWSPHTIAPAAALAKAFGEVGANEAYLMTNLAPMADDFSSGIWQGLMNEITSKYPKRFGDIWVYLGPIIGKPDAKLDSGVPIPDGFYAIAFDLTEAGGLRAIAFLVPQTATAPELHHYITSISIIEKHTGLQFLSEVDYHAREVLGSMISPQLW